MTDVSRLSSLFTRRSLLIQQNIAKSVLPLLPHNSVLYIFDSSNTFTSATIVTINKFRVLKTGDLYALLSQTAQEVFTDKNHYYQFSDTRYPSDTIGIYMKRDGASSHS